MIGTLARLTLLLLSLAAGAASADAQPPGFSPLARDADVLQGVIETISPQSRTLVLRGADGSRQTIHYDAGTTVFTGEDAAAAAVAPGQDALVHCRRLVGDTRGPKNPDLCPVRLFAESVYLASH